MDYEYNDRKQESVYSRRLKAGKRRTYFFDVRETRGNDFFLTITESRKRFNDDGYDRHKIFLYKEDFNKFVKALGEAVDYVKTELMPDYDFDIFSHEGDDNYNRNKSETVNITKQADPVVAAEQQTQTPAPADSHITDQNNHSLQEPVAEEIDTADMEAEPMHSTPPIDSESSEETIEETSTAEKLASEEVEKW